MTDRGTSLVEDFYTWTQRQAASIRDGQMHQSDLANIADGSKEAALETGLPASIFPIEAPFTLNQALNEEFWPAPRPTGSKTPDGLTRA